jgi:hypothetical protein
VSGKRKRGALRFKTLGTAACGHLPASFADCQDRTSDYSLSANSGQNRRFTGGCHNQLHVIIDLNFK